MVNKRSVFDRDRSNSDNKKTAFYNIVMEYYNYAFYHKKIFALVVKGKQ